MTKTLESHYLLTEEPSGLRSVLSESDDLIPVLLQCFALIFIGYLSARLGFIAQTEWRGLSVFVTYFSLPALIFKTLSTYDLANINWSFIISIFISKTIVFIFAVIVTLTLTSPSNVGKAALYGIFCTQSNDFALGYPLVKSLYGANNPQFAQYLYVMAPIQLAIINPVALFMLEIHKHYSQDFRIDMRNESIIANVLKGIIKNPILMSTLLGIAWNLLFDHTITATLTPFFDVLADSFTATALFLLGFTLNGKIRAINTTLIAIMVPMSLVITKILILPLLNRVVVAHMAYASDDKELQELTNFSFLYGTFPSAPTVFIFSLQYAISSSIVSSGLVLSTVFSAPLMFIAANMIRKSHASQSYEENFDDKIGYSGLIIVFCVCWAICALICFKRNNSRAQQTNSLNRSESEITQIFESDSEREASRPLMRL